MNRSAKVFSPTNIALAKYWGKRDLKLNLPQNSSLSATLENFGTKTEVSFSDSLKKDLIVLNGTSVSEVEHPKIVKILNLIRERSNRKIYAEVITDNNFPTAAGLASSASGISALVAASVRALSLDLTISQISELCRLGSGSACRSLFSGFVEWSRGELADGSDSVARSIASVDHWPFEVLIAVTKSEKKSVLSTDAMEHSRKTSPFFADWITNAQFQCMQIKNALLNKEFELLALLTESNCLRMHSVAMSAQPSIVYWNGQTIDIIHLVQELRRNGIPLFFTIDAGPNVVIFIDPSAKQKINSIKDNLNQIGVSQILETRIGHGTKPL